MNENTTKLLETLSNRLGTTSQYLWEILLKQAPVEATINLIQILMIWFISYLIIKIHFRLSKKDKSGWTKYDENEAYVPLMVMASCIMGVFIIISLFCINDVISGYINPEYWALDKILNSIK